MEARRGYEITFGQMIYRTVYMIGRNAEDARQRWEHGATPAAAIQDAGMIDDTYRQVTVRRSPEYDLQ